MDHYYDKLLHIANFRPDVVQNEFYVQEAARRVQPLVDVCLSYGQTGQVPIELIKSYMWKLKISAMRNIRNKNVGLKQKNKEIEKENCRTQLIQLLFFFWLLWWVWCSIRFKSRKIAIVTQYEIWTTCCEICWISSAKEKHFPVNKTSIYYNTCCPEFYRGQRSIFRTENVPRWINR